MALGDMKDDRSCLEQREIAFLVGRNLAERMKRQMCGLLHRAKRNIQCLEFGARRPGTCNVVWGTASMTIVLVHGNPEIEAIWDDLVPRLRSDDVVRLSPPGFGSAIPTGFDCSTDAYRDWLAGELTKLPQPIDLI